MYRIKIDRSRCIGCLTCVTACVVSHETESGDARNRVTIDSETKPAPIFCRHCDRPECVYTCMTGAMKKGTRQERRPLRTFPERAANAPERTSLRLTSFRARTSTKTRSTNAAVRITREHSGSTILSWCRR